MSKLITGGAALAFAVVSLIQPARGDTLAGQTVVSIGAAFPISSDAHQLGFHTLVDGGLDYHLSAAGGTSPIGLYGDYSSGSGLAGMRASTYALGFEVSTEAYNFSRQRPYVGLGVGYGRTVGSVAVPNFGTINESKWGLAGKLFVGTYLTQQFGVEASYELSPGIAGVKTDSYGIRLMIRLPGI